MALGQGVNSGIAMVFWGLDVGAIAKILPYRVRAEKLSSPRDVFTACLVHGDSHHPCTQSSILSEMSASSAMRMAA